MSIEVEYIDIALTGPIGSPSFTGMYPLIHAPSTGPNGYYDIAVDPIDGPAQQYGKDFGVTHLNVDGTMGAITINLADSDIKDIVNSSVAQGVVGMLTLRVVYNYEP